jgi:hypothetical protein
MIYRINTPALRMLFMAPGNRLRMRDGLISLLAGSIRGSWEQVVPVLAFKSVYYIAAGLLRAGLLHPDAGLNLPRLSPAE